MRGEPDYFHQEWMRKSVPVRMEKVVVMHYLPDKNDNSFFDLLDNFKIGFTLAGIYLLSFFGILALAYLFNELSDRIRSEERRAVKLSKRIAQAVNSFEVKRLSAIGLFVLFVHLFLWVTELFLTNNIKTNKVVRLA